MSLFEKLMRGDVDGFQRDMKEREFRNLAQVFGHARDRLCKDLRPTMCEWLKDTAHDPRCGFLVKGDLLRWTDKEVHGRKLRLPTVRVDMVDAVKEGKVTHQGVELALWITSKLNEPTFQFFAARTSLTADSYSSSSSVSSKETLIVDWSACDTENISSTFSTPASSSSIFWLTRRST